MDDAYEPPILPHVPLPPDFEDESPEALSERARIFCETANALAELMVESKQPLPVANPDEKELAVEAFSSGDANLIINTPVAIHLRALLNEYDMSVVSSAQQIRNFCTNILLEKARRAKTDQAQLKAVELLGKIKDVGLFEERTTVLVENMSTEEIQRGLRNKINRIRTLAANDLVKDVTPHSPPAED